MGMMGLRVVALSASPRGERSRSKKLLRSLLDHFQGHETLRLDLEDHDVRPCIGCFTCCREDRCPLDDQANLIKERLSSADIILLGTPVYFISPPAQLKAFLDRTLDWAHRPHMFGKPVAALITSAGCGEDTCSRILKFSAESWGASWAGHVHISIHEDPDGEDVGERLEAFAARIANSHRQLKDHPPTPEPGPFHRQVIEPVIRAHPDFFSLDHSYWKDRGWLEGCSNDK